MGGQDHCQEPRKRETAEESTQAFYVHCSHWKSTFPWPLSYVAVFLSPLRKGGSEKLSIHGW